MKHSAIFSRFRKRVAGMVSLPIFFSFFSFFFIFFRFFFRFHFLFLFCCFFRVPVFFCPFFPFLPFFHFLPFHFRKNTGRHRSRDPFCETPIFLKFACQPTQTCHEKHLGRKGIHHQRGNPPLFLFLGLRPLESMVYTLLSGPMAYTLFPCFPRKMVYTIVFSAL